MKGNVIIGALVAIIAAVAIACGGNSWSESDRLGYLEFCRDILLGSEAECECSMEVLEEHFDSPEDAFAAQELPEGLEEEELAACVDDETDDGA